MKCYERSSNVPDPSAILTMSVRAPEASLDNDSATESDVDSQGPPSRGDSMGESIVITHHPKMVGGENVKKLTFFTDVRPLLCIFVSKVTQVLCGLQMVETSLRSGRDSAGGLYLSLFPSILLLHRPRESNVSIRGRDCSNSRISSPSFQF